MYIYIRGLREQSRRYRTQLMATNQTTKTAMAACSENLPGKCRTARQSEYAAMSREYGHELRIRPWGRPKTHGTWVGLYAIWARAEATEPIRRLPWNCPQHGSKSVCIVPYSCVRTKSYFSTVLGQGCGSQTEKCVDR